MSDQKVQASYNVPPVERALKLLRYIGEGNKARNLSTVARDLDINRTTLIRLIHTLQDNRMIEPVGEDEGYRLGVGLVSLGAQAIRDRDIVKLCQPILARLCQTTGMSAHLGVIDHRDIVYLARETPASHLVSNIHTGSRLPAHASSIGRAILAELPETELRDLFSDDPIAQATEKTPTTIAAILDQARLDKADGFAWSEGNFESGIGSCAAVIFDHTGTPAGALNVSGPEARFADRDGPNGQAIRDAVTDAAQAASERLGHF